MAQEKNKTNGIVDYLVIAFVLATTMLVLVEIGGNVGREIESRPENVVETIQPTSTFSSIERY